MIVHSCCYCCYVSILVYVAARGKKKKQKNTETKKWEYKCWMWNEVKGDLYKHTLSMAYKYQCKWNMKKKIIIKQKENKINSKHW